MPKIWLKDVSRLLIGAGLLAVEIAFISGLPGIDPSPGLGPRRTALIVVGFAVLGIGVVLRLATMQGGLRSLVLKLQLWLEPVPWRSQGFRTSVQSIELLGKEAIPAISTRLKDGNWLVANGVKIMLILLTILAINRTASASDFWLYREPHNWLASWFNLEITKAPASDFEVALASHYHGDMASLSLFLKDQLPDDARVLYVPSSGNSRFVKNLSWPYPMEMYLYPIPIKQQDYQAALSEAEVAQLLALGLPQKNYQYREEKKNQFFLVPPGALDVESTEYYLYEFLAEEADMIFVVPGGWRQGAAGRD